MNEGVRVAFVVVAHTNGEQVARLVTALRGEDVAVFVHLDRRAGPGLARRFADRLGSDRNVVQVSRRRVHWGHFSVVEATLDCLDAIRASGLDPGQTVLLSGQDYPIKPMRKVVARLAAEPGRAFVRHWPVPTERWGAEDGGVKRFDHLHIRLPRRGMVRLPLKRPLPRGWAPFGGPALCALGRPHRRLVLELRDERPDLMRYFRRTLVPDELFFPTVLMNSPLRYSVVNESLHYIRWSGRASPDVLGRGRAGARSVRRPVCAQVR